MRAKDLINNYYKLLKADEYKTKPNEFYVLVRIENQYVGNGSNDSVVVRTDYKNLLKHTIGKTKNPYWKEIQSLLNKPVLRWAVGSLNDSTILEMDSVGVTVKLNMEKDALLEYARSIRKLEKENE